MRSGVTLAVLLLGACAQPDPDGFQDCVRVVRYADLDGDGYGDPGAAQEACPDEAGLVDDATDCDDGDSRVHPGATEEDCTDPVDYDCDGVPAGADGDADGFAACEDCDDTDPAVYPGHDERCNGKDDDCDGEIDEGEALDAVTVYVDGDGDGHGDPERPVQACEAGEGTSATDTDCDDADAAVHPDAAEVLNGLDDDCDLVVDVLSSADAPRVLVGAAAGDRAGVSLRASADLTGDGLRDLVLGATADDAGGEDAGAIFVWSGPWSGRASLRDAAAVIQGTAEPGGFGSVLAAPGDIDGDGHADLLAGSPDASLALEKDGAAFLFLGPLSGRVFLGDAAVQLQGSLEDGVLGSAADRLPDLDGLGNPGLLVGARRADPDGESAGRAYLLPLDEALLAGTAEVDTLARATFTGELTYTFAGYRVLGSLDLTGDGLVDPVVAAPGDAFKTYWSGKTYVVEGPASGTLALADSHAILEGEAGLDFAGLALSPAGDVDGDGHQDLLLGAPGSDRNGDVSGATYLVLGPFSGERPLAEASAILEGPPGSYSGTAVHGGGDVDGDGAQDVLVGAWYDDRVADNAGVAFWLRGPLSGTALLEAEAAARLEGQAESDVLGAQALLDDLDEDGLSEIFLSAWLADDGPDDAGSIYGWSWLGD